MFERMKGLRGRRGARELSTTDEPLLGQRLATLEDDFEQIVRDVAAVSLGKHTATDVPKGSR